MPKINCRAAVALQKHPWYRKGLPQGLQLDAYNLHYVELSKAAANSADLAKAIKRVMQVCRTPYAHDAYHCSGTAAHH